MKCVQCDRAIGGGGAEGCVAAISGEIMGDEYTESFFLCDRCGAYTVEVCYAPFLGEEVISVKGPIPRETGDATVNLIKSCSEPWNKKCRCQAHITYFEGALD